jgi:tetratricopeptide (TPR) repeat protein
MKVGAQSNTAQLPSNKQSVFSWSTVKPFAWAAVFLIFLLILLPYLMQFVAFLKYDTGSSIADQVKQQADQTQNLLNLLNTFAAIMGVVFAVFAAITVALGVYGFSTNNGFRDLEKDWQERLNELAQKSVAIATLEEAMKQRNEIIVTLVEEMQEKSKQLKQLQEESSDLRDQLRKSVTSAQASLDKELEEVGAVIRHLGTAHDLISGDPSINLKLGRILNNGGDYTRAIELLEATVLIDPDFPEVHGELGLAYRRRGDKYNSAGDKQQGEADYSRAIDELKRAIRQDPHDVEALSPLGGLYRRRGDYKQAMKYYQQAVDVAPESSYALGNVASLAWYIGEEEFAREMFKRTEKAARKRLDTLESLDPDWDYFDIGLAQLMLGKPEAARETYKNAIELTPSRVHFDSVLHNLSMLKSSEGGSPIADIDEIIKMIENAR